MIKLAASAASPRHQLDYDPGISRFPGMGHTGSRIINKFLDFGTHMKKHDIFRKKVAWIWVWDPGSRDPGIGMGAEIWDPRIQWDMGSRDPGIGIQAGSWDPGIGIWDRVNMSRTPDDLSGWFPRFSSDQFQGISNLCRIPFVFPGFHLTSSGGDLRPLANPET